MVKERAYESVDAESCKSGRLSFRRSVGELVMRQLASSEPRFGLYGQFSLDGPTKMNPPPLACTTAFPGICIGPVRDDVAAPSNGLRLRLEAGLKIWLLPHVQFQVPSRSVPYLPT
jgi:hypothetical protein